MSVIRADSVTVRAGRKALLDGISLDVALGEVVALVGPNGAGKSTLLRVLSGELQTTSGAVELKSRPLAYYSPRELALHRAVLSQATHVAFPFTVGEVVRMGGGDRQARAVDELAEAALSEVDLADFRDRIITTLSGGEQQRAHFARVLVQLAQGEETHGPGILLLDEPTASLDLKHQLQLLAVVSNRARRGHAVVMVLHDLNLAALAADRIVMLDRGTVAAVGTAGTTITDEIIERVFGVRNAVSRMPALAAPFVLPHAAEAI